MNATSALPRALSLITAVGVSLVLLQSVAALPASMPAGAHGPVMAQGGVHVAALGQVAPR